MIVESDTRRDDIDKRKSSMRERSFQNWYQLLLIARKTARDKCRPYNESEHDRIDRGHLVCFPSLALRSSIGRRRKLTLSQSIQAVILDDVDQPHVAPDGMAHLAQAYGKRVAVARYTNVG